MKIQPIVEGHGEVEALPVLLRRLIDEAQVWTVGVGRPIRRPRTRLVQEEGVTQAVRLALEQPQCGAVLVLFDGNSDCPAELGPSVEAWATAAADDIPCRVVRAHREYEAWFLAAIESLRGSRGIRTDAQPHPGAGTSSRRQGATGHVHAGGRALSGDGRPGGTERDVFRCLPPIAGPGRSASSPTRLGASFEPWGTTSPCGRRLRGSRMGEAVCHARPAPHCLRSSRRPSRPSLGRAPASSRGRDRGGAGVEATG